MHSSNCGCLITWVHTMPHETIYVRMYIHIMTLLHVIPYNYVKTVEGEKFHG